MVSKTQKKDGKFYVNTTISLTEDQYNYIKKYYSKNMSEFFRRVIDKLMEKEVEHRK